MEKVWGVEYWIVNEPLYCAKILFINPNFKSSLHHHKCKRETFIVLQGTCAVWRAGIWNILGVGQRIECLPYEAHEFRAIAQDYGRPVFPCIILEISTHHDDNDVVRLSESGPL